MVGWLHHHCGAGRGGAGVCTEFGVPVPVPGRYPLPNMYCKTYCTVSTKILSLESGSAAGLANCLEKSSLSILRRAAAARAGLFAQ